MIEYQMIVYGPKDLRLWSGYFTCEWDAWSQFFVTHGIKCDQETIAEYKESGYRLENTWEAKEYSTEEKLQGTLAALKEYHRNLDNGGYVSQSRVLQSIMKFFAAELGDSG